MRSRIPSLRALISLFVALAFAIAVTPGSMAMPAPHTMKHADCASMAAPDHAPKEQGKPCKGMTVCLGMLSCFGMAAIVAQHFTLARLADDASPLRLHQIVSGLTIPPDDRPPIA